MSLNALTAAIVEKLPVAFLEHLPGMQTPPGEIPNFVNPPNQLKLVLVLVTISCAVMLGAIGLRIYSKFSTGRPFFVDDCKDLPLGAAWSLLTGSTGTSLLAMVRT
jgi:hypothetical protein